MTFIVAQLIIRLKSFWMFFVIYGNGAVIYNDFISRQTDDSLDELFGCGLATAGQVGFFKNYDIAAFRDILVAGYAGPGSGHFPDD